MKVPFQKAADYIGSVWDAAWYIRNGYKRIAQLIGGSTTATHAGKSITVDEALQCSVPYVCTRAITETLSAMPLPVLRKVGENMATGRNPSCAQLWQRVRGGVPAGRRGGR